MSKIDNYHQHECLDRLHVAMEMVQEHIVSHKYMEFNNKAKKKAQKACGLLMDAYQLVGADERLEH